MSIHVPLDRITDNPYQTRSSYDEEQCKALADDIQRNGLLQPPVARLVDADGQAVPVDTYFLHEETIGSYWNDDQRADHRVQLAFGHSRLRAARLLGWATMPITLQALTDEQMATFAWSENEKRSDINPADEAAAIARMIESFSWTQEQAAEHLGMGRSTLANKLRILRLPAEVLENVRSGKLSERQAIALVGLYDVPEEDLKAMADSYYSAEGIIERALKGNSSDRIRQEIEGLQDTAQRERKWREEEAKRKEKAEKTLAKVAASDPGKIVDTSKLSHSNYEHVTDEPGRYDYVEGCSPECACRRLSQDGRPICIDPNHRRQMKAQATKAKKKAARADIPAMLEAFAAKYRPAGALALTPAAIALISEHAMSQGKKDHLVAALKDLGLPEDLADLRDYGAERAAALDKLAVMGLDTALMLILQMWVRQDLGEWIEYTRKRPDVYDRLMASKVPTKPVDSVNQFLEPEPIADLAISGDGQASDADVVTIADNAGVDLINTDVESEPDVYVQTIDADTQRAMEERAAGRHTFSQAEIEAVAEPEEEDLQPSEMANLIKRHKDATCWRIIRHKTKLLPSYIEQELATLKELLQDVEAARHKAPGNRQILDLIVDIQLAQTELHDALKGKGALKS